MVEPTRAKKKKKRPAARRERKERRFIPQQTQTTKLAFGAGMVGALLLGAGVYAQWIRDPALSWAPYLVAAGAAVLGVAIWLGDTGALAVRVGDAGLAIEKGSEVVRLAWCDMERVYIEKGQLVARGEDLTLTLPVGAHRTAIAWVLAEGTRRVPDAMDVKRSAVEGLPEPKEGDGDVLTIDAVQVAGRHCASSDKPIAFEPDARLCPTCGEVYHKDHVPQTCVTCGATVGERAFRAA
jgi:hypothetical protein